MPRKKLLNKQQLDEIKNKKVLAEVQELSDKMRLDDERFVMEDLTAYFTAALVPVKPTITYKDFDDRDDGQPRPMKPTSKGAIYQEKHYNLHTGELSFLQKDAVGRIVENVPLVPVTEVRLSVWDKVVKWFKKVFLGQ